MERAPCRPICHLWNGPSVRRAPEGHTDHCENPQTETCSVLSVFSGRFISKPEGGGGRAKGTCVRDREEVAGRAPRVSDAEEGTRTGLGSNMERPGAEEGDRRERFLNVKLAVGVLSGLKRYPASGTRTRLFGLFSEPEQMDTCV